MAIAFSLASAPVIARAEGVDVLQAQLEPTDEGFRLSASYGFELNRSLEDALMRGIPLYFKTEVAISRPRWYWFDETTIRSAQTVRVSYNLLTRQYRAATASGLQQSFPTLDDAMAIVRRPPRWIVAPRSALKNGEVYNVSLKMELDVGQLPKPFQVNAINNSDWRLSSDWRNFILRVDGR